MLTMSFNVNISAFVLPSIDELVMQLSDVLTFRLSVLWSYEMIQVAGVAWFW